MKVQPSDHQSLICACDRSGFGRHHQSSESKCFLIFFVLCFRLLEPSSTTGKGSRLPTLVLIPCVCLGKPCKGALVVAHDRSREKWENQEKDASPAKINGKIVFSGLRNPVRSLSRCSPRSKIVRHSQKTTNTRAAETAKLNVVCPETLSKVHAIGAGDVCAPGH